MSTETADRPAAAPTIQSGQLPVQQRAASIVPGSFDPVARTVEVVWTAGARRRAYDWWNETPYEEELAVTPEAVDMTRFDAGVVQVIDGHRTYGGVSAILGIALRGWLTGGEGRATLKLSQREELAGIVGDIEAGIIRAISFGYSVERYEITRAQDRTDGINMPLYRAARWTPQEISFVTVPADPSASTRAQRTEGPQSGGLPHPPSLARAGLPCEFVRAAAQNPQENLMTASVDTQTRTSTAAPATTAPAGNAPAANTAVQTPAPDDQAQRDAAATDAANRAASITELCTSHRVPHLAAGLIRGNSTLEASRQAVLDELVRRDAAAGGHLNVRGIQTVRDEGQTRLDGAEEALMSRVDSRVRLSENGAQFRGMSLLELGRELLEARGVNTRGLDRMALAGRMLTFRAGMQGTSDFGSLLSNVAWKRLRAGYDENPGTYIRWARRAPNAPDFKNMSVVQLSAMPDLLQTNEHGEFKYGSMRDGAETYALLTYGRIVALTRQAIINDDLRGFDRMVAGFGAASARLENRTAYAQITANANLGDGVALFHATHGNLGTGAGSALSLASLGAGRTAMRLQKGLQGEELNISPAYLIAPAALEQTAYQLTSSNYTPARPSDVNEFRTGGRTAVEPVIEPILDGNSATAWYLGASNGQVDTVEYCYLDGAEGPVLDTEMGFEVDGISIKARLDFAAKAIDYRGLYKAAGA